MIKIDRVFHFSRRTGFLVCYDKLVIFDALMWWKVILPSSLKRDAAKSRGRSFTCFKVRYCSCCEERSTRSKKMKIAGKKNLRLPDLKDSRINLHRLAFSGIIPLAGTQCSQPPPANMGHFSFNLHLPSTESASPRSQIQSLVGAWSRSRM